MTEDFIKKYLRNIVKEARKRRGLTQKQLAERLGYTKNTVTKIETVRHPDFHKLLKIAEALDLELRLPTFIEKKRKKL